MVMDKKEKNRLAVKRLRDYRKENRLCYDCGVELNAVVNTSQSIAKEARFVDTKRLKTDSAFAVVKSFQIIEILQFVLIAKIKLTNKLKSYITITRKMVYALDAGKKAYLKAKTLVLSAS